MAPARGTRHGARVPSVHACQARLVSHLLTLAPAGVRASKQPTGILQLAA